MDPLAIDSYNDVFYMSLLQEKCQQYWPGHINITETKGPNLYITVTSFVPYAEYQIRKIQIRTVSFSLLLSYKKQAFLYNILDSYVFFRHQSQGGS